MHIHKCTDTEKTQTEVAAISCYHLFGFLFTSGFRTVFHVSDQAFGFVQFLEFFSFYRELCLNTHVSLRALVHKLEKRWPSNHSNMLTLNYERGLIPFA